MSDKTNIILYNEEMLKKDSKANFNRPYQQCSFSLMDTIADPDIVFDKDGISNYFHEYHVAEKAYVFKGSDGEKKTAELVKRIQDSGRGKMYDCITGVSGGVDSTYLTYMAKQWGLHPLVVHFDNGWNSEAAVKNIENIISKLGFELYTLVVDWEEFRDIQLSYFKASVVDIEAITDHAIIATLHKLAHKYGIKYILSGSNVATEATLPKNWIWNKSDHVNLKDIHTKFGNVKLKTFPLFSNTLKKLSNAKGVEVVTPLNYMAYNKAAVKKIITAELSWRDYGGKHYESVFTRFYQGYILPVKFNIDKRKAHLSNLIFSGEMTKDEANEEMKKSAYSENDLPGDYEFVIKKLNYTESEFRNWLKEPRREHYDFKVDSSIWKKYFLLRPFEKMRNAFKK